MGEGVTEGAEEMTAGVVRVLVVACVLCGSSACDGRRSKSAPGATPAAASTSPATQSAGAPLIVTITDLRNQKGRLVFGVFKSAEGFPSVESRSVFWEEKDAAGGAVTFTTNLPPGRYAASVLHDENRSGDMDRGVAGIPLEGYGVTNNPKPRLRAATFKEATFPLPPEGARMTISVQYF